MRVVDMQIAGGGRVTIRESLTNSRNCNTELTAVPVWVASMFFIFTSQVCLRGSYLMMQFGETDA